MAPQIQDSNSNLPSNDYHYQPASEKQLRYARDIASRAALELPQDVLEDRRKISA